MKKILLLVTVLATAFTFSVPAALADSLNYTYTDTHGVTATGLLTGTLVGSNEYQITAGTITLTDLADPTADGMGVFVTPVPAVWEVGGGTTLNGLDTANNNLFLGQNPQLDANGALTFNITSGAAAGTGFFIGSLGANNYQAFGNNWKINDINGGGSFNAALVPTPEPSSLILFGTGLLGACGLIRRQLTV